MENTRPTIATTSIYCVQLLPYMFIYVKQSEYRSTTYSLLLRLYWINAILIYILIIPLKHQPDAIDADMCAESVFFKYLLTRDYRDSQHFAFTDPGLYLKEIATVKRSKHK